MQLDGLLGARCSVDLLAAACHSGSGSGSGRVTLTARRSSARPACACATAPPPRTADRTARHRWRLAAGGWRLAQSHLVHATQRQSYSMDDRLSYNHMTTRRKLQTRNYHAYALCPMLSARPISQSKRAAQRSALRLLRSCVAWSMRAYLKRCI